MSEEFGPVFITITDEDGNDIELELVDTLEHNGIQYSAFFPALTEDTEEEESELIILKAILVDGEEMLSTLDTDEELNEVYDLFMEQIFSDDED